MPAEAGLEAARARDAVLNQRFAPVVPFLNQSFAHAEPVTADGGAAIGTHADLGEACDVMSQLLRFRARLFAHVQRLSLAYHDMTGIADSTYRIQYDAQSIQTLVISGVVPLVTAVLTVGGMLYVTAMIDWRLGLIASVPNILIWVAIGFIWWKVLRLW